MHIDQKQRVGIFVGQMLVDQENCQVDYIMYKSTTKGYNSTKLANDVCVNSRPLTNY